MDDALGQSSSEPSMADLIATLDAVEAEEAGAEQEAPEGEEVVEEEVEQPRFTVKVDGKEIEVTQDELLRGYQREADYTRKTQEVADARRAFEREVEGVRAKATDTDKKHEAVVSRLSQAEAFLQANLGHPPGPELAQRDAQQYLVLKAAYDERLSKLQGVHNALEREKQDRQQSEAKAATEQLDAVWDRLTKSVKGWSDPKVAAAGTDALIGYVTSLGMTRESLSKQTDYAFWDLALKAQQFDKLQGMRAELKGKQTKQNTTTARPGVSQPNAAQSQRQQVLAKTFKAAPTVKNALAMAEHLNL